MVGKSSDYSKQGGQQKEGGRKWKAPHKQEESCSPVPNLLLSKKQRKSMNGENNNKDIFFQEDSCSPVPNLVLTKRQRKRMIKENRKKEPGATGFVVALPEPDSVKETMNPHRGTLRFEEQLDHDRVPGSSTEDNREVPGPYKYDSKVKWPSKGKRVTIDLDRNTAQGVKDYHMSVEQRPAIPYDASKKPGKAALKKLPVGNQNNKRKKLHK